MGTTRLEAFSDGVIAILITIMVLDLRPPIGESFETLLPLWPVLSSYVLSFLYLGISWNNHHHMFHATRAVTGPILWANLHLLLMAAIAFWILQLCIIRSQGPHSLLRKAVGSDWKGKLSPVFYLLAIPAAFLSHWIAAALYLFVALLWLVPDRRIERVLQGAED
ncbi:MAG TPA: TMEM175 family protein [Steroidobacteraceae bacterium]|nr:TMEM175 family protein [Steroidobacteraceae bacterium]